MPACLVVKDIGNQSFATFWVESCDDMDLPYQGHCCVQNRQFAMLPVTGNLMVMLSRSSGHLKIKRYSFRCFVIICLA
jgi:hypothetical protein